MTIFQNCLLRNIIVIFSSFLAAACSTKFKQIYPEGETDLSRFDKPEEANAVVPYDIDVFFATTRARSSESDDFIFGASSGSALTLGRAKLAVPALLPDGFAGETDARSRIAEEDRRFCMQPWPEDVTSDDIGSVIDRPDVYRTPDCARFEDRMIDSVDKTLGGFLTTVYRPWGDAYKKYTQPITDSGRAEEKFDRDGEAPSGYALVDAATYYSSGRRAREAKDRASLVSAHRVVAADAPRRRTWRKFAESLDEHLSQQSDPALLLFIHGYNTSFVDALDVAAYLSADFDAHKEWPVAEARTHPHGTPIVYSWPTRELLTDFTPQELQEFNQSFQSILEEAMVEALGASSKKAAGKISGRLSRGQNIEMGDVIAVAGGAGVQGAIKGAILEFARVTPDLIRTAQRSYGDSRQIADAQTDDFVSFVREITQRTRVKRLNIVAHSMGNRILVNALDELLGDLPNADGERIELRIAQAAPDFGIAEFRSVIDSQSDTTKKDESRWTIYASQSDISFGLLGQDGYLDEDESRCRLGEIDKTCPIYAPERSDMATIDASSFKRLPSLFPSFVEDILFSHSYFVEAPMVSADLTCVFDNIQPHNGRALARPVGRPEGVWTFTPDAKEGGGDILKECESTGRTIMVKRAPGEPDPRPRQPLQQVYFFDVSDWKIPRLEPVDNDDKRRRGPAPDTLPAQAKEDIADIAAAASVGSIAAIYVIGYADSSGEETDNNDLSLDRAEIVADMLKEALSDAGVPAPTFIVRGKGEPPQWFSHTEGERDKSDRRVEITIKFDRETDQ